MKHITERVRAALADKSTDGATWRKLRSEMGLHLAELDKRLAEIGDGGPVRQQLAMAGDTEGLIAMSAELPKVKAQRESAAAIMVAVNASAGLAEARDAGRELPKIYQGELLECVKAEEAAIEAWRASQAATAQVFARIKNLQMKYSMRFGAATLPSADEATLERLLRARNLSGGHLASDLAATLGIDLSEYRRGA